MEVPQVAAAPISTDVPHATLQQTLAVTLEYSSAALEGGSATPTQSAATNSTPAHGQNLQPIFEQEDDEDPEDEQEAIEHPRLRQTIQWDHPIDNILGSLRKGVITHSYLANFCQYYSFVSSLEPLKVEQALGEPNWVMACKMSSTISKEIKCGPW